MANFFSRPLRLPKVPHSFEDMSHNFKTTTKFGLLTPVGVEEVVPSDETKEFRPAAFMRLSPLLYPIMHRVTARLHTFEVPFRIILGDKNYQNWLNGQLDFPDIDIEMVFSDRDEYDEMPKYDIFTTLGYPRQPFDAVKSEDGLPQVLYHLDNGLDYLAMLVIWREWFADGDIDRLQCEAIEDLIESYQGSVESSAGVITYPYEEMVNDLYASMPQDYFTTARPQPQYGDPVNLTSSPTMWKNSQTLGPSTGNVTVAPAGESPHYLQDGNANPLTLDLTIRELWRREQVQRYWDVTNTFGSRTREWVAGHFGIIFPDDRLMIPRLLQTVKQSFTISEVMQTSSSTESSPLGAFAGKGTLAVRGNSFKRFYVEHGLVITLLSVVPVTGYANGQQRYQFKKSVFDFAIPEFNNIGYQEIYKGELYNRADNPKEPFGYTLRFSEYRSHPNRCSNGFSDDLTLLDFHLNRKFDSMPGLNHNFITANQEQFYRIFADEAADMDSILVDCAIIHKMWRPVSVQPTSMHL